jgi:hypothetical protein
MRIAIAIGLSLSTACDPSHWEMSCHQLWPPKPPAISESDAGGDIAWVMQDEQLRAPTLPSRRPAAPTMQCTRVRYLCGALANDARGCRGIDGRVYPLGCMTETPPNECGGISREICTDLVLIPRNLSYFDYDFELEENKSPNAPGAPHWHRAGQTGPSCIYPL